MRRSIVLGKQATLMRRSTVLSKQATLIRRSTILSLPLQLVFPVHSNGRLLSPCDGPKISALVGLKMQELATTLAYNAAVLIYVLKFYSIGPGHHFYWSSLTTGYQLKSVLRFKTVIIFLRNKKVYFYSLKNDIPCYKAFSNSTRCNTISQSKMLANILSFV